MGTETTRALQRRRRRAASQIDRLIARAEAEDPIGSAHRARTCATARTAHRALRVLADAQVAVAELELHIGRLLVRLVGQGMSRNEAFALVGLRRHVGRRYLDLALRAQTIPSAGPSTVPSSDAEPCLAGHQRGRDDGDRRRGRTSPGDED